jgi:hypothetical protein
MPTTTEYEAARRKLKWPGLQKLWADITAGTVDPWWPKGKAFEYLVVRMFELDKAQVTWSYPVYLFGGKAKEQIGGAVRFGGPHWLVESKDEDDTIAMDPIAKLRNQMRRRPWGTSGLVFTSTKFTPSAVQMTHLALLQPRWCSTRRPTASCGGADVAPARPDVPPEAGSGPGDPGPADARHAALGRGVKTE